MVADNRQVYPIKFFLNAPRTVTDDIHVMRAGVQALVTGGGDLQLLHSQWLDQTAKGSVVDVEAFRMISDAAIKREKKDSHISMPNCQF